MKIEIQALIHDETKKSQLIRFLIGLAILSIYTSFLVIKYGSSGFALGAITWSAFVLATPIADGGLLLDFPIRLITGMRMVYSEILVWVIAIGLNIQLLINNSQIYSETLITNTFHKVLTNPWPYWGIIFISAIGTFISIYFGDELLDVMFHKERKKYLRHHIIYKTIAVIFFILLFYFIYKEFLSMFGLQI
ncbi:MAG: hypothetical protein WC437_01660 [Patescibacteria group bacterium]|jgi:hypothetical protein|nr:hypothetical protein [Patescibacteria group bacterium]